MTRPIPLGSGRAVRGRMGETHSAELVLEGRDSREQEQPPDSDLLALIRAGDARGLDGLLERYWAELFRYAARRTGSRDVAADITQDVFCRLWERRASWRSVGSVRGLLFRLARNTAVSHHRRHLARQRASDGFAELHLNASPAVLPAERAELRAALEQAIAALPARRREVFLLRMIDDLSYEEIAEVMGTSKQTVANQLSHALAGLRLALAHLLD